MSAPRPRTARKSTFPIEKIRIIAISIIILANYAANAFFHAMEMQDPVRTSYADVPIVEKKMDKVRTTFSGVLGK